jgi:mRNA interferase MazF
VRRGEIHWADLFPRSGSEQTGRRPAVILSHNGFNQAPGWQSIIVVPVSSSGAQARRGPTVVELPAGTAGLRKLSFALCHQVTTLDRSKLGGAIGTLPFEFLRQVEDGVKAALDLD